MDEEQGIIESADELEEPDADDGADAEAPPPDEPDDSNVRAYEVGGENA